MRVSADYLMKFALHDVVNSPYGGAESASVWRMASCALRSGPIGQLSARRQLQIWQGKRRSLPVAAPVITGRRRCSAEARA